MTNIPNKSLNTCPAYHGYIVYYEKKSRWNLPLYMELIIIKSKGFVCLLRPNSPIYCFCLKQLIVLSQINNSEVSEYLNVIEKSLEVEMLTYSPQLIPKI